MTKGWIRPKYTAKQIKYQGKTTQYTWRIDNN